MSDSYTPVETKVVKEPTSSAEIGVETGAEPIVRTGDGGATTRTVDPYAQRPTDEELEAAVEDDEEDGEAEDATEGDDPEPSPDEGEDTTKEVEGVPTDLGEFKPEDAAEWDAVYRTEGGELNMEALYAEWWSRAQEGAAGPEGTLRDGTYAYLASIGLPKDIVQDYESHLKAQIASSRNAIVERAGGAEAFDAAREWGRKGGYTKEQQDRFNAVLNSGDAEAVNDAVDALMARYRKANPEPTTSRPRRSATDTTTSRSGAAGYETKQEWEAAFAEARKSGDARKMGEVRARLKASKWYGGRQ